MVHKNGGNTPIVDTRTITPKVTVTFEVKPKVRCPFCDNDGMAITEPVLIGAYMSPAYRCGKCNTRIVVTNQYCMPGITLGRYWHIVLNKLLGKQDSVEYKPATVKAIEKGI